MLWYRLERCQTPVEPACVSACFVASRGTMISGGCLEPAFIGPVQLDQKLASDFEIAIGVEELAGAPKSASVIPPVHLSQPHVDEPRGDFFEGSVQRTAGAFTGGKPGSSACKVQGPGPWDFSSASHHAALLKRDGPQKSWADPRPPSCRLVCRRNFCASPDTRVRVGGGARRVPSQDQQKRGKSQTG
jgi:hypothetical protein